MLLACRCSLKLVTRCNSQQLVWVWLRLFHLMANNPSEATNDDFLESNWYWCCCGWRSICVLGLLFFIYWPVMVQFGFIGLVRSSFSWLGFSWCFLGWVFIVGLDFHGWKTSGFSFGYWEKNGGKKFLSEFFSLFLCLFPCAWLHLDFCFNFWFFSLYLERKSWFSWEKFEYPENRLKQILDATMQFEVL